MIVLFKTLHICALYMLMHEAKLVF